MKRYTEKRKCSRFEIPGAYIRYKKRRIFGITSVMSEKSELVNISKGGVCFMGCKDLSPEDKITVYLHLPDHHVLASKGTVNWVGPKMICGAHIGVKFAAFNKGYGYNPIETLYELRSLEEMYLDQNEKFRRAA